MRWRAVRVATHPSGGTDVFVEANAKKGTLWLQLDAGNNGPIFLAPHALAQRGIDVPEDAPRAFALRRRPATDASLPRKRRGRIYDGQLGLGVSRHLAITLDLEAAGGALRQRRRCTARRCVEGLRGDESRRGRSRIAGFRCGKPVAQFAPPVRGARSRGCVFAWATARAGR